MLCHVFWSQVEYKIVCFIIMILKVGNYSLKILKSAVHLFSVFISKRGFSPLQIRTSFAEILSGNHRVLRPGTRLVTPYNCAYLTSFIFLTNKSIVYWIPRLPITNNTLAVLLPSWSDYVWDHWHFCIQTLNTCLIKICDVQKWKQLTKTLKLRS